MAATPVVLRQVHKPSPFAFPIMVGRFREKFTSEKLADRVARMQLAYDEAEPPEDATLTPALSQGREGKDVTPAQAGVQFAAQQGDLFA
jgi:ATP-dependent Lhr-like helicase